MKTVLITALNPFIGRNILFSGVLEKILGKGDVRVVIIIPEYKRAYFEEELKEYKNIVLEGINPQHISRQDILFRVLANAAAWTSTIRFHRRRRFKEGGGLLRFIGASLAGIILANPPMRALVRALDYLTISRSRFAYLFEKHNPVLVFATDVYHDDDVHFLAEGCRRGVKTVGMVRSWDNVTNKGMFRVRPHELVVHNDIIKEEAARYANMPRSRIAVVGLPQFDIYKNFSPNPSDATAPTILLAPNGERFHGTDWQILEILKKMIAEGDIPKSTKVIVRLPPNDTVQMHSFVPDEHFTIEHPGKSFKPTRYNDREVTREDALSLAKELCEAKVVLHFGSTIGIDAAFLDRPNIMIAFDGFANEPYYRSVRKFNEYTHLQKYLKIGSTRIARTKEELKNYINHYLAHPESERAERARLVKLQCAFTDGLSATRLSETILKYLPK